MALFWKMSGAQSKEEFRHSFSTILAWKTTTQALQRSSGDFHRPPSAILPRLASRYHGSPYGLMKGDDTNPVGDMQQIRHVTYT